MAVPGTSQCRVVDVPAVRCSSLRPNDDGCEALVGPGGGAMPPFRRAAMTSPPRKCHGTRSGPAGPLPQRDGLK